MQNSPTETHAPILLPLVDLFDHAVETLKYPSLTLQTMQDVTLFLCRTGNKSKIGIGNIAIKSSKQYENSIFYGYITREGAWSKATWYPDMLISAETFNDLTRIQIPEILREFTANPASYAAMHGKKFNHCCFCALELTHPDSVAVGYGPICAEKWGLPHAGMAKEVEIDKLCDELDADFSTVQASAEGQPSIARNGGTTMPAAKSSTVFKPLAPFKTTINADADTTQIRGILQIDHKRGVIYFHDNEGSTPLRICSLPKNIPVPTLEKMLDITHMKGTNWTKYTVSRLQGKK